MKYFYIENDEQKGPLNFEELKSVSISGKTLIWHEGLDEWTEAKNIESISSIIKTLTPPKIPTSVKTPPKFESSNKNTTPPQQNEKKNNGQLKVLAVVSITLLVLLVGNIITTKSKDSVVYEEPYSETPNYDQSDDYSKVIYNRSTEEYEEQNNTPITINESSKPTESSNIDPEIQKMVNDMKKSTKSSTLNNVTPTGLQVAPRKRQLGSFDYNIPVEAAYDKTSKGELIAR